MTLQKLSFRPGLYREGTAYSNEGGWYDGDKVLLISCPFRERESFSLGRSNQTLSVRCQIYLASVADILSVRL